MMTTVHGNRTSLTRRTFLKGAVASAAALAVPALLPGCGGPGEPTLEEKVANNIAYDPDVAPRTIGLVAGWVREGNLDAARIEASYQRILRLKRWARLIG